MLHNLSDQRRKAGRVSQSPSSQIDTDADATEKRGKKYFGYKGHIEQDVGSAYSNKADKQKARKEGIYYGMLDKGTRKRKFSKTQKKRNRQKSKIRCKVEHPFSYMKEKLGYKMAVAKNLPRNAFRFDMNCMLYNIMRTNVLLERAG